MNRHPGKDPGDKQLRFKTKLGKDAFISHKVSNLLPIILASLTVRMDWLTKVSKILKINSCFQYVPSLEVRRK
jgi:hypothetical protein